MGGHTGRAHSWSSDVDSGAAFWLAAAGAGRCPRDFCVEL